ncbi:FkbM family methyltransferase [Acidisoma silvae]|uniref:FkbM family methyltransferase n=1 Tax=Acidisoma silvae TaxID=2802396 RepID=A0A964DZ26_9PROT|nr:FkbM family methyltransferase [Acidisoma silvae]MCB8875657.1 FkbM family methyltransferase [Acidisoma silvae]
MSSKVIPFDAPGRIEMVQGRHGPIMYHANDMYVGASLRLYGEYSPAEARLFAQLLRPGATIVEVGANIGSQTVHLSKLAGPKGRVFAFEPFGINFRLLSANLALCGGHNVQAHHIALGDTDGFLRYCWPSDEHRQNFGSYMVKTGEPNTPISERIPIRTLDSFALNACDFLKVDVEGFETAVLRGAADTIRRCRPIIVAENDRRGQSPALIQLLQDYGYQCYWWYTALFDADNFFAEPENIFGGLCSGNLFAAPAELNLSIVGMTPVSGPDDIGQEIFVDD